MGAGKTRLERESRMSQYSLDDIGSAVDMLAKAACDKLYATYEAGVRTVDQLCRPLIGTIPASDIDEIFLWRRRAKLTEISSINYREIFRYVNDITGNNDYIITGYKAEEKTVAIPSQIQNLAVTKIGDSAFKDCESLEQVNIADGILEIGREAFCGCKELSSVSIPNSVKVIGPHAFEECWKLREVNLTNGMLFVGEHTFRNCHALEHIHIPSSVRSIGFRAFEGCDSLLYLHLPARFVITPMLRAYYGINENVNITFEELSSEQNKVIAQATIGETIEYGRYPNTKDGTAAPIIWRVIAEESDKKMLLADCTLDYRSGGMTKKWSHSVVRSWLNYTFSAIAFSIEEQQFLCYQQNNNPKIGEIKISGRKEKIQGDKPTTDLVFLLSVEEIEQYMVTPQSRICAISEYANEQKKKSFQLGSVAVKGWMTRSDIASSRMIVAVNEKGSFVGCHGAMMRPCISVSTIPEKVTLQKELTYHGRDTFGHISWLICNCTLSQEEYDPFVTEYTKMQRKKIIQTFIDEMRFDALDKVFSISEIVTAKEMMKLIDTATQKGNAEVVAYLLQKKNELFQI